MATALNRKSSKRRVVEVVVARHVPRLGGGDLEQAGRLGAESDLGRREGVGSTAAHEMSDCRSTAAFTAPASNVRPLLTFVRDTWAGLNRWGSTL